MRKIFLYMTMTFDGFFAGPNNELDWMVPTPDPELIDDIVDLFKGFDGSFIGYPTALGMIAYWSNAANNPSSSKSERAIAQAVNNLHAFLVSNKEEKLSMDTGELLVVKNDNDLAEAVTKIKEQPGKDLVVSAGIRTAQTFVRLGLIDEYVIMVHPIALGVGKMVFSDRTYLELVSVKTYKSGIMRVCYRPR